MKSTFAAICAAGAVFSGVGVSMAQAQNQLGGDQSGLSNPSNMVQNFSVQTVGPVLNELGVAWQVHRLESGEQYINALYGSALNFVIFFAACQGEAKTGCIGMNSVAFFETSPNQQTVQAFNFRYQFASAGVDPQGTAYISRYDIADYGIPRGNIASSIANFATLAANFSQELETATQTVSLEGFAGDMSSSHLNRQGVENVTGIVVKPSNRLEAHQIGFEEGAEMVRQLLKDEATPRNKISNTRD